MAKKNIKHVIKENTKIIFIIMITIGIVTFLLYISDIGCLIKYTVGVPCPACGLTRAWLSFFKMDLREAFRWHPLFWVVPFIIIIEVIMKGNVFQNKRKNAFLLIFFAAVVIGIYIVRMIILFPDQPPMDYNKESLIYKGIMLIDAIFIKK